MEHNRWKVSLSRQSMQTLALYFTTIAMLCRTLHSGCPAALSYSLIAAFSSSFVFLDSHPIISRDPRPSASCAVPGCFFCARGLLLALLEENTWIGRSPEVEIAAIRPHQPSSVRRFVLLFAYGYKTPVCQGAGAQCTSRARRSHLG